MSRMRRSKNPPASRAHPFFPSGTLKNLPFGPHMFLMAASVERSELALEVVVEFEAAFGGLSSSAMKRLLHVDTCADMPSSSRRSQFLIQTQHGAATRALGELATL